MWLGPLHDRPFVDKMLETVNAPDAPYHTLARLKGMLNVARHVRDRSEIIGLKCQLTCWAF